MLNVDTFTGILSVIIGVISDSGQRQPRDLVLEKMVMRSKKFSPMDRDASPLVGGGILERKIKEARNGTAGWCKTIIDINSILT